MAIKLMTHSVGPIALAAALPGGAPANTSFTLTSSGEPFCIVGFYVDAARHSPSVSGLVQIELSRINGSGVSHPMIELADGWTVKPQDLVISLGSVMSSSNSLSFHLIQWPAASGTGVSFDIDGRIVFLAEETVTLIVAITEP
jgi:hypothetical protein